MLCDWSRDVLRTCDTGNPPGKLAAARNVTLPVRQYTVNGERRSFSLL